MSEEDVGNSQILPCTWVITEKETKGTKTTKARLCVMGNKENGQYRRDSPTVSKTGLRMLFMIASNENWPLESLDAKSAFLQGDQISRIVHVRPPKEYQTEKNRTIWKLRKCLYGLGDAPRGWYRRVDKVLLNLGMERMTLDHALYALGDKDKALIGCLAVHVDDFVYAGNNQFFRNIVDHLKRTFVVGEPGRRKFSYVGWQNLKNWKMA